MLNQHSQVGIAQIVFYVPAVLAAITLFLFRKQVKGLPRFAWYVLTLFTLVRLAGGIVVILYENNSSSTGLAIASVILLNAGVFPCIAATIGFIKIMLVQNTFPDLVFATTFSKTMPHSTHIDYKHDRVLHYLVVTSRLLFLAGIGLLVGGGVLEGNYNDQSSVQTGIKLSRAGYCVVAAFVGTLLLFLAFFWVKRQTLSSTSLLVLRGVTMAVPFFIVRLTYAFLSVYRGAEDKTWDSLSGPIAPFLVMGLLMEYFVVVIYLYTGFKIKKTVDVVPDGEILALAK
ncbi:hypothetical protein BGW36DRAFT_421802 [Talaromyces proteolyticus]|uniref:DUF7702 domain-containing protein n=1 Tax=Talaromyces proteolyticus TaxID=1131652 RepID=A0AAD4Q620_9EURO|nr:uncharacterized protein BGW36DRAFT_421802 [Talaromyces proteolyticus]KAH8705236.1 hypothetical protein BGW36DRAFT_421802 [Talaromyces proteolyticus]